MGKTYIKNDGNRFDEFGMLLPAGTTQEVVPVIVENIPINVRKGNLIQDVIESCINNPRTKSWTLTQEINGKTTGKIRINCRYQ